QQFGKVLLRSRECPFCVPQLRDIANRTPYAQQDSVFHDAPLVSQQVSLIPSQVERASFDCGELMSRSNRRPQVISITRRRGRLEVAEPGPDQLFSSLSAVELSHRVVTFREVAVLIDL